MDDSILIIGSDSVIGSSLLNKFRSEGRNVIGTSRRKDINLNGDKIFFDLSVDFDKNKLPSNVDVVYFCAAITNLQYCRGNPKESSTINVESTVLLLQHLVEKGAFVIFLSTNLVFDGMIPHCLANNDLNPIEVYGYQKAVVEKKLLSLRSGVAVLRLSKVVHSRLPLFVRWYSELKSGNTIYPYSNMTVAPVSLRQVVDVLEKIGNFRSRGVFQLSGNRDVSYAYVADFLAKYINVNINLVQPCNSTDLMSGSNVQPPIYTSLDSSRVRDEFNVTLPNIDNVLEDVFLRLVE